MTVWQAQSITVPSEKQVCQQRQLSGETHTISSESSHVLFIPTNQKHFFCVCSNEEAAKFWRWNWNWLVALHCGVKQESFLKPMSQRKKDKQSMRNHDGNLRFCKCFPDSFILSDCGDGGMDFYNSIKSALGAGCLRVSVKPPTNQSEAVSKQVWIHFENLYEFHYKPSFLKVVGGRKSGGQSLHPYIHAPLQTHK